MKRVISILGALVILMTVSLIVSCGGGSGEVVVPPQVDIHPTPTITVTERLQQLGLTGIGALFEPYDEGDLRVVWQDPDNVLGDGDRTDYGASQVFARYYDLEQGKFVEANITSFVEVEFLATAGNPTAGGDRLLWFLNWHEIEPGGTMDITGTVRIWADDFVRIWDQLNGGPLASLEDSFSITVETTDGLVEIDDDDGLALWAAVLIVGLSRIAPVAGYCPQVSKSWQVSREEEITPPVNQNPVASLVVSPVSGVEPLYVTLDASDSHDPDGTISKYEWDFEGDGVYDNETTSAIAEDVPYSEGTYVPRVRVTDNDGAADTAIAMSSITVTAATTNQPPVAVIQAAPTSGPAPLIVNFNGSDSHDPDGSIIEYAWDFTSNQATDEEGISVQHTYSDVGVYTATLYVTDDDGVSRSSTVTITVTEPQGPIWGDDPYDWTKVQLDVTPEAFTLHSNNSQTQQVFADLFYNGSLVYNGSQGRYFEIEFSTNAPTGSLTADGLFDSTKSGNGNFTVTVTATLQTVPLEHNVFTVNVPVNVLN